MSKNITIPTPTVAGPYISGIAKGGRGTFSIDNRTKHQSRLWIALAKTGTTALTNTGLTVDIVPKWNGDAVGPLSGAAVIPLASTLTAAVSTTIAAKPSTYPVPAAGDLLIGTAALGGVVREFSAICEARAIFDPAGNFRWLTEDVSEGTPIVDVSTDAGDAGANDVTLWPATPATNDANYIGNTTNKFPLVEVNIGTAASALVMTAVWEYWNGAAWTAFNPQGDGTAFLNCGAGNVFIGVPYLADWAKTTVLAIEAYWIRCRCLSYASKTTIPLLTQAWGYEKERLEFRRVILVTSTTRLDLEEPLKYAHTVAQADRVTSKADVWSVALPGNTYCNVDFDYGNSAGEGLIIALALETLDAVVVG